MQHDLLSSLKDAYDEARSHANRHGMDIAAQAISYAMSGERELAANLAEREGLIAREEC
ncbi:hypothetical protein [Burkholderia mayonis]|uniref:hypothetical protein n=1 Tax=Burkholderia mayonis TaxID=1385591 RepID=UPI000A88166D|nr:hypothetical protein [Burkholderia mayonis]